MCCLVNIRECSRCTRMQQCAQVSVKLNFDPLKNEKPWKWLQKMSLLKGLQLKLLSWTLTFGHMMLDDITSCNFFYYIWRTMFFVVCTNAVFSTQREALGYKSQMQNIDIEYYFLAVNWNFVAHHVIVALLQVYNQHKYDIIFMYQLNKLLSLHFIHFSWILLIFNSF